MKKKLLLLGGSTNSMQILNTAHELGYDVGVVDYYPTSKCKQAADFRHQENVFNTEAISEIISANKYNGLITGYSEKLLKPYVSICHLSGVPCYGSRQLFEISTDKSIFKNLCRNYDVPVMAEYKFEEAVSDVSLYPLVVKPVDSAGSIGVAICNSPRELEIKYKEAEEISMKGEVLIERCASGREATFFYFFNNGEVYCTIYGDRFIITPQGQRLPMPVGYIFPGNIKDEYVEKFNSRICQLFENEGFNHGMAFAQVFVEPDGIYLNEIGYRLTPSFETFIIKEVSGFDPVAALIQHAVNDPIDFSHLRSYNKSDRYGANLTFLLRKGVISKYLNLETIASLPGIVKVLPAWEEGHEISEANIGTLAQVGLRVLLVSETKKNLIDLMDKIKSIASVLDENGNEMIIKDYSYRDLCL